MEVSEANLQQLADYLQKTLATDPVVRREAEKFLESIETNRYYSMLLLNVMDKGEIPIHIRVTASVVFKNFIKRNWTVSDDGVDKIHGDDRQIIRDNIVGVMLKSPDKIQKQLSDAISCIGKEDFPHKWPSLMHEMIDKFQTNDFSVIVGILHTAHSIFRRYRHEFKSDKLWREIKFVLDAFAAPFTELTGKILEFAQVNANNRDNLKLVYNSLILICKIFYSLNFQDLPEFFEDNMVTWMNYFHILLTANENLLPTDDKDEPGVMEQVKTQVCDNLVMYVQKYDEEFSTHLPVFVNDIWNLLINTSVNAKYDLLVSNAIQFLASVAERPAYKKLFEDPVILSSICEKVIVPNMEFRDADEEAFEENAEEYIRRDIEGSDVDTRRRAACDLVRALSKSFEDVVIHIFSGYIQHMLELYQQNPKQNWKSKDAAIFLVTTLAAKAQTQKHGITQTSQLVNVVEFFDNHIHPDFKTSANENPVIKADAIKYVMVFRSQLPKRSLVSCLPFLMELLRANSHVVHSYSACCIEKILSMKPPQILRADISPYREVLLVNLCRGLQINGSEENEYIMRAIMRSLHTLQEDIMPFLNDIFLLLLMKLNVVSKNPSKPHFNHLLFESMCIIISISYKSDRRILGSFEEPLFELFQSILQQDVLEFVPYVFQVLSLMLEMHSDIVPDPYMALFPLLLQPLLWERTGNIPALVRLLQAYITIGMKSNQIASDKLPSMLGVFQKLLASRTNDHYGVQLLSALVVYVPHDQMSTYIKQVLTLMFQRLTTSKTTKYVKCVVAFFSLYVYKYSAGFFIELIEKIQPRLFDMVLDKLLVPEIAAVNVGDRKICAVGVTKILCEPAFIGNDGYSKLWVPLLQSLVQLLECPSVNANSNEDQIDATINQTGDEFQTAYSQLVYSGKREIDYCHDVADAKVYFAQSLHLLCSKCLIIKDKLSSLPPDVKTIVNKYLT